MRTRLFAVSVLFIAISLLSPSPSSTTIAAADDCSVVNQVCNDMGQMMYDMCMVGGNHTPSQCAEIEANFRIQCKKDNGCPPSGN